MKTVFITLVRITNPILLIFATLLISPTLVFAQGGIGTSGGGGGVYCIDPITKKETLETLDYYQAKLPYSNMPVTSLMSLKGSEEEIINRFLRIIQDFDKNAASKIGIQVDQMRIEYWKEANLSQYNDFGITFKFPVGCVYRQIAFRQNGNINIDPEMKALLSPSQRAILRLHEAIYYIVSQNVKDSSAVRDVIGYILEIGGYPIENKNSRFRLYMLDSFTKGSYYKLGLFTQLLDQIQYAPYAFVISNAFLIGTPYDPLFKAHDLEKNFGQPQISYQFNQNDNKNNMEIFVNYNEDQRSFAEKLAESIKKSSDISNFIIKNPILLSMIVQDYIPFAESLKRLTSEDYKNAITYFKASRSIFLKGGAIHIHIKIGNASLLNSNIYINKLEPYLSDYENEVIEYVQKLVP